MKLAFAVVSEELKKEEGFKSTVYKCSSGKHTIGFGRNLDDRGITLDEANELLRNDICRCDEELSRTIPNYSKLNGPRQYVIISMCYNLGLSGVIKFKKMWQAINEGDFSKASLEMLDSKWAGQVKSRAIKLSVIMKTGEMPK